MKAEFLRGEEYTTIRMAEGRPFRILQLTDIHLGGGWLSRKKDKLALDAVEKVVRAANADFIVVTGDMVYPMFMFSGTSNNLKATKKFADKMESLGVPWTCVFGNHDEEPIAFYKKERLADYYESLKCCFFRKGEKDITGVGNHWFRLEKADGTLNMLLMMIDSNSYTGKGFFSGFDVIHDDQLAWYERIVRENSPEDGVTPSLAFFHIPPAEFKEGWEKCYRGDPSAKYRLGFVGEKDNYFGYAKKKKGNFVERMEKLGSCKGFFVGHDHLNTLSIDYRGMRMTYGMSIDYLAYVGWLGQIPTAKCRTQRGGTVVDINADGTFDVSLLPLADIEAAAAAEGATANK